MKKEIRQQVHNKFNGHCAYCGKEISIKDMQVDHIYPKHLGGTDDIKNLFPSCRRCNHYKRADTLTHFRQTMETLHERIQKDYICKVAEDYGIIKVEPWNGKFYFDLF